MKKKRTVLTAMGVCLLLAASTTASAQHNLVVRNDKQPAYLPASLVENATSTGSASNAVVVSEKISRKFANEFTGASNAVWQKDGSGFMVWFTSNGIRNCAYLTKKGNNYLSVRYYTEKELPAATRNQIESAYPGFAVATVREVCQYQTTAYLVTIGDATTWKVIRDIDGETEVLKEYAKG